MAQLETCRQSACRTKKSRFFFRQNEDGRWQVAHFLLFARLNMAIIMHPPLNFLVLLVILSLADGFCQTRLGKRTNQLGPLKQSSRVDNPAQNAAKKFQSPVIGPPVDTKPDYERIVGPLGKTIDNLYLKVFRAKLAEQVGSDSALPATDFKAITELAATMNKRFTNRLEIQQRAQNVLRAIFPSWLPKSYAILFARPFPQFSARMNAWATKVAGTWLMGECEINDVEFDGGVIGKNQGLLVKRCRFLEESGCASICVNSCKVPTQNFFIEDMGLPLTMEPNYETFECQFSFGATPNPATELEAKETPCLKRCPTAGSLRSFHDGSATDGVGDGACQLMDDDEPFLALIKNLDGVPQNS